MSRVIKWNLNFAINKDIDREHKEMIDLANRLFYLLERDDADEELAPLFHMLADMMAKHFGDEERLMDEYNYSDIDAHCASHRRILRKVHFLCAHPEMIEIFRDDMHAFITDWLVKHITDKDCELYRAINDG